MFQVLEKFPKLVNLNIYNAPIPATAISKISSRLLSLNVGKSPVFFAGKRYAGISLENLRVLDIKQNSTVNDSILSALIDKCPLLEELNLEFKLLEFIFYFFYN